MNLATVPTWFWIAAAVLAFVWLKRRGVFDAAPKAVPSRPARSDASPAAQVVEIRHAFPNSEATAEVAPASTADPLTQTLRHTVDFQIDVKPVPKLPPGASP